MTRKQAELIVDAAYGGPAKAWPRDLPVVNFVLDALDRAGAFPSEATEAEIASVATSILRCERNALEVDTVVWYQYALRLASACRAAGLVR